MTNVTPLRTTPVAAVEAALIRGDLANLTEEERLQYYNRVCESVGLNPMTQPFEYITLNGKLKLYARKDCTDQLRTIHKVSVIELIESDWEGVFMVTAKVQNGEGRTDAAKGAVSINNLKGEALANALMKAETKAKRRATLSICGLGFLDEVEVDDIPAKDKEPRILKKDTRALYTTMQAEMDAAAASIDGLKTWGAAAQPRIKQLPTDWQFSLTSLYETKLADLQNGKEPLPCAEMLTDRWAAQQAGSLVKAMNARPDADGVIWEETHERAATAADEIIDDSRDIVAECAIVCEEIKALIVAKVEPTDQRKKIDLLSTHLNTTSWTEITTKLPLEQLQDGLDTMTFTLTGKHSRYHQQRLARMIAKKPPLDHTETKNGTPAFLERKPQPYSQREWINAFAAE